MDTLNQLKDIEGKALDLNRQINLEGKVYAAELADRRAKNLTGDAARQHYNEWMAAHNMQHLMTE